MYTLYGQYGTRSTAAEMVLAESELTYELREIDITENEHKAPEYLAINPRGTIPALVDDDGTTICETIAIMLYLTDKHDLSHLAPPPTDPLRGKCLDWLVYHATEVQEPVKRSYYPHRHALRTNDVNGIRKAANETFLQRWQVIENHLRKNGTFHLSDSFSIVDLYLLATETYSSKLVQGAFPAIKECVRKTSDRPLITAILEKHKVGVENFQSLRAYRW